MHGKWLELLKARGVARVLVSLSHTDHYGAASAVIEGEK